MHRIPKRKSEIPTPSEGGQVTRPDKTRSKRVIEHVKEDELKKAIDQINKEDAGLLRRLAQ